MQHTNGLKALLRTSLTFLWPTAVAAVVGRRFKFLVINNRSSKDKAE